VGEPSEEQESALDLPCRAIADADFRPRDPLEQNSQ
jgi:hypothetical protein